jgi:hypothetical protein
MEDSLPPMAMMVDTRPSLRQEKQLNVDFRITLPADSLIEPESRGCVFLVVCRATGSWPETGLGEVLTMAKNAYPPNTMIHGQDDLQPPSGISAPAPSSAAKA